MSLSSPLPSILSPTLLESIRKNPALPKDIWYLAVATTVTILNRPDEIPKVYAHVMQYGGGKEENPKLSGEEQLRITKRIREALIKASSVGGVPKTINSIIALKEETSPEFLHEAVEHPPSSRHKDMYETSMGEVLHRGEIYFQKVYGKVSERVMGQMDKSGTEDLGLVARLVYAYILSDISILSESESSFVLIAALIPQDLNAQLKGHLRGALNLGATVEEVRAVRKIVIRICEAYGMTKHGGAVPAGWGWREEVADL
ncbi:carboxymuconolactone decarboxylase [Xylogone sp. PMI_703]|nr:carboxymuconolactone decarboxylase [Xylogone sp. PMI_703]